jgi:hypothetical protein
MYENILFAFLPHHEGVGFLLIKYESKQELVNNFEEELREAATKV